MELVSLVIISIVLKNVSHHWSNELTIFNQLFSYKTNSIQSRVLLKSRSQKLEVFHTLALTSSSSLPLERSVNHGYGPNMSSACLWRHYPTARDWTAHCQPASCGRWRKGTCPACSCCWHTAPKRRSMPRYPWWCTIVTAPPSSPAQHSMRRASSQTSLWHSCSFGWVLSPEHLQAFKILLCFKWGCMGYSYPVAGVQCVQ